MKARLPVGLAALALIVSLSPGPDSQGVVIGPPILAGIAREPLLVHNVSGGTLTGPINTNLTLFGDGSWHYSSRSSFLGTETIVVETGAVAPSVVKDLYKNLLAAGAGSLPDQTFAVSDVPLNTLTFMRPATNAFAHTFSYFIGVDGYGDVQTLIGDFISTHIPTGGTTSSS